MPHVLISTQIRLVRTLFRIILALTLQIETTYAGIVRAEESPLDIYTFM